MINNRPNVFIACSGVGFINRGFESFTKECFSAIKENDSFEFYLLKGGGTSNDHEIKVKCVKRNSGLASFISLIIRQEAYWIEQMTFLIGMMPSIIKYKPSVIYYSDFILGTFLWRIRSFFKFKYKLLFSNGAPNGPPFKTEDHIQQLLPMYIAEAKEQGTPDDKQTLLPYAININVAEKIARINETKLWRESLRLPVDKKIIISVGALNTYHKRMDYIVDEFSKLDQNVYFLLILGQIDNHSTIIIKLAEEKLNVNSYSFKQVSSESVPVYMATCDYFVLASLSEGLPRVLPEALSNGLIPIVHDYPVTRQTLNHFGAFKDLTKEGALFEALKEVDEKNYLKAEIIDFAWESYSWDNLKKEYLNMIIKLIDS